MIKCIGIIRETKNEWERRTPLIPVDIKKLSRELPVNFVVQPSPLRVFSTDEYLQQDAATAEDLSTCEMILGIKEVKVSDLLAGKIYLFFSHTIKGQAYNMPMLHQIIKLKDTLIDYEKMIDEKGQRLIYFSYHAGLAGVIDTLWAVGQKLAREGIVSPLAEIKHSLKYTNLDNAIASFQEVGEKIKKSGLPAAISPFIIGITGYGNVSRGVQHLLDFLPVVQITPAELANVRKSANPEKNKILKVIFREEDMVESKNPAQKFDLQDYYQHPEKYQSRFDQHAAQLSVLINTSFWNRQYPRHVTKKFIRELYSAEQKPALRVIGDISCDVEGGIECTLKTTTPGNPVFIYLPDRDEAREGFAGHGPLIMAVDNLPCELPAESSTYFSSILSKLIPDLVNADYGRDFAALNLPPSLKKAVVVYKGELTPDYQYLRQYLDQY
jgi:Alanine dehydrogenase/PNT, N-terminal domain/Alanine dehydrogenase/PNT, C-terminal domain